MLEYAKTILPNVSFSKELFRKELFKCINWVNQDECEELKVWCYKKFGEMYPMILEEAFSNHAA